MKRRNAPRGNRIRSKVVALLLSLALLWGFAAYVTVREGLNLLGVSTLYTNLGQPVDATVQALAAEREISLLYIATGDVGLRDRMQELRDATDAAIVSLAAGRAKGSTQWASFADTNAQLARLDVQLATLTPTRQRIDDEDLGVVEASALFNSVVDTAFYLNRTMANWDDDALAARARALVNLVYSREVLAREDALVVSLIARGDVTATERAELGQLIGMRRYLHELVQTEIGPGLGLEEIFGSTRYAQFRAMEWTILGDVSPSMPVSVGSWRANTDPILRDFREIEVAAVEDTLADAVPAAIGTIARLVILGILGLAAVVASIIISITTARRLVRQLERLRNAARDLAAHRLPRVVERLQAGEPVDIDHEAPPLDFGRDEIGQVGHAFNAVQSTAVRVAVEQAELRRSVRDVFLSLARRSQALLHRQLTLLDAMERRTTDSEELAELFRIDHLATRMRRNAENLIVLSGSTAGRSWRKPVPMVDVLRGALAEVEDYTRVTVLPVGNASLQGRAVGDVIHLLAELIENAVSFSPPQTVVRVGGSAVGYGFAIEIEDRGLGMSEEERALANEQLLNPPEFRLTSTARLGLYVVGKLAERHGIKVRLTESAYGGTTAVVLLPGTLMADDETDEGELPGARAEGGTRPSQLATATVGRHRHASDAAAVVETPNGHHSATATVDEVLTPSPEPPTRATDLPVRPTTVVPAARSAPEDEQPALTPSGLPWRRRRPLEPSLTSGPTAAPAAERSPEVEPAHARGLEETRTLLSSYRSGAQRGRADASKLADGGDDEATTPPTEIENGG